MNWFYAHQGQRAGPVDEYEFARLVTDRVIIDATLVWHSGMPDWMPYAQARATIPGSSVPVAPGPAGSANQAQCSQCGRVFPATEVIRLEGLNVCAECKPVLLQKMRQGIPAVQGAWGVRMSRFAGFWIRFGAVIVDALIMLPVSLGLNLAALYAYPDVLVLDLDKPLAPQLLYRGLGLAIGIGYEVFFTARFGGTPGKLICGLRVVRGDGSRITYGRALGRYFARILSAFTLCIGFLIAAFDDQKRALHDYMVDTRVVYKD